MTAGLQAATTVAAGIKGGADAMAQGAQAVGNRLASEAGVVAGQAMSSPQAGTVARSVGNVRDQLGGMAGQAASMTGNVASRGNMAAGVMAQGGQAQLDQFGNVVSGAAGVMAQGAQAQLDQFGNAIQNNPQYRTTARALSNTAEQLQPVTNQTLQGIANVSALPNKMTQAATQIAPDVAKGANVAGAVAGQVAGQLPGAINQGMTAAGQALDQFGNVISGLGSGKYAGAPDTRTSVEQWKALPGELKGEFIDPYFTAAPYDREAFQRQQAQKQANYQALTEQQAAQSQAYRDEHDQFMAQRMAAGQPAPQEQRLPQGDVRGGMQSNVPTREAPPGDAFERFQEGMEDFRKGNQEFFDRGEIDRAYMRGEISEYQRQLALGEREPRQQIPTQFQDQNRLQQLRNVSDPATPPDEPGRPPAGNAEDEEYQRRTEGRAAAEDAEYRFRTGRRAAGEDYEYRRRTERRAAGLNPNDPAVPDEIVFNENNEGSLVINDPSGSGKTFEMGVSENPNNPGEYFLDHQPSMSGSSYGEALETSPKALDSIDRLAEAATQGNYTGKEVSEYTDARDAFQNISRESFPPGRAGEKQFESARNQARDAMGQAAKNLSGKKDKIFAGQKIDNRQTERQNEARAQGITRRMDQLMGQDPGEFGQRMTAAEAEAQATQEYDERMATFNRLAGRGQAPSGQPQGSPFGEGGYDYENANKYGITRGPDGHMASRVPSGPDEGLILKSENHPTFGLTVQGETQAGMDFYRATQGPNAGRLYSFPRGTQKPGFAPVQTQQPQQPQPPQGSIPPEQFQPYLDYLQQIAPDFPHQMSLGPNGQMIMNTQSGHQFAATMHPGSITPVAVVQNENQKSLAEQLDVPYVTPNNPQKINNPYKPGRGGRGRVASDATGDRIADFDMQKEGMEISSEAYAEAGEVYDRIIEARELSEMGPQKKNLYTQLVKEMMFAKGEISEEDMARPDYQPVANSTELGGWAMGARVSDKRIDDILNQLGIDGDEMSIEAPVASEFAASSPEDQAAFEFYNNMEQDAQARLRESQGGLTLPANAEKVVRPSRQAFINRYGQDLAQRNLQQAKSDYDRNRGFVEGVTGQTQEDRMVSALENSYSKGYQANGQQFVTLNEPIRNQYFEPVRLDVINGLPTVQSSSEITSVAFDAPFYAIDGGQLRLQEPLSEEPFLREVERLTKQNRGEDENSELYAEVAVNVAKRLMASVPTGFFANRQELKQAANDMIRRLGFLSKADIGDF